MNMTRYSTGVVAERIARDGLWCDAADVQALEAEHAALRAEYEDFRQRALLASEQRLDEIATLREALMMTRHTLGDLRNGFAQSVDPARWVHDMQTCINDALRRPSVNETEK